MEVIDENKHSNQLSVSDWVLTIFLSSIPVVGLILLLIWAFGDNQPSEKVNWAKATLIWYLIGIVVVSFFFMLFGAALLAGMAGMNQ
jgi:hypothetical protein